MLNKIYDTECAKNREYGIYDYLVDSMNHDCKIKPLGFVDRSRYAFTYQEGSHNYMVGQMCNKKIGDKYCYRISGDTFENKKIQQISFTKISGCEDELDLSLYSIATLIDILGECKKFLDDYPEWKLEICLSESLCADNKERQSLDFYECFFQVVNKFQQLRYEYDQQKKINQEKANNCLKGLKHFKEKSKRKMR